MAVKQLFLGRDFKVTAEKISTKRTNEKGLFYFNASDGKRFLYLLTDSLVRLDKWKFKRIRSDGVTIPQSTAYPADYFMNSNPTLNLFFSLEYIVFDTGNNRELFLGANGRVASDDSNSLEILLDRISELLLGMNAGGWNADD